MSTAPLATSDRSAEEIDEARALHQDLASDWVAGSSYAIPGMASRPDSCGQWFPFHVCDSCAKPIFSESYCGLRRCPECWFQWVQDTAEKIVYRLQCYRWAQADGLDRRLIHGVFSPAQSDDWTISRVDGMRRESYNRADEAGISGGCALTHLWRTTEEFDREFRELDPPGGKWQYLRREYGRAWRTQTEVSPHVHQIAVAPEFEPEQDDWIARRIRTLAPMRSLSDSDSYTDLADLAIYLLTHTAIADGEQALRWFGSLYPGGFNPEEELSKGALDTIERMAAEAVGQNDGDSDDDEPEIPPEQRECDAGTEGCPGERMAVWDVPSARRTRWWEGELSREAETRLDVVVAWMMGDLDPPPVRTEQEARDLLHQMVENMV